MAYALVKTSAAVATGTTSAAPTFGQSTTAGNLLVAWVAGNALNGATTTVSGASGWTRTGFVGSTAFTELWYKPNCAAGETAPTFNNTAAGSMVAALGEWSGGATSSPVDQVGAANNTAITPITCTASAADAAASELFVTVYLATLTKTGTNTTTLTSNHATTMNSVFDNDSSSVVAHYRMSWGVADTGGSSADSATATSGSMSLSSHEVQFSTFKLPAPVLAQPCMFASSGMLAKALDEVHRVAGTWRSRRRSGILVPDLWLPGPVAVPAAV